METSDRDRGAPFISLRLFPDGGLAYEIDMEKRPTEGKHMVRLVGNAHMFMWHMIEWATQTMRVSDKLKELEDQRLMEVLANLNDDATQH